MVEGEVEMNEETSVVRLLVVSTQVGCLLRKSGGVIKQMASERRAQIRILQRDKLPACASSSDELLLDHPAPVGARDKSDYLPANNVIVNNINTYEQHSHPHHPNGRAGHHERGRFGPFTDMLTYHLRCPNEKVGGVIRKGGATMKALKHETGCDIKILE
ncbi:unnamed protein product [Lactuca saligna]|uniref:K Homology domain-containing protein n=1 Tax=Lactuca saligna TaxID=75948 RepID=A0AA35Y6H8_LACSI|nr:unnamed protein product [Lactuca saligna]